MSLQTNLSDKLLSFYPDAEVKKINRDNYVDIHIPQIHKKKGTHLFFNTSKGKIKLGFYCREEEFVSKALTKSNLLEKYAQGIRLKDNPEFETVDQTVQAAITLINAITGGDAEAQSVNEDVAHDKTHKPHSDEGSDADSDEKGFPLISFRIPSENKKEVVNAYFKKWQEPSYTYAWRMGITAYIPEFIDELVSNDVCPVFTEKQIKTIYNRIKNDKVIPVLSYAPDEFFHHTKQVWWIVPFCIWKGDVASMVFVDKNGIHALFENEGELQIVMIFPWDEVNELDFEYAVDDDPNICRLTFYHVNGGYLTFDEFVSEGKDNDHGSYLSVVEAIWEARRETIKASKEKPFWLEGEGGETFEVYEHPSNLYKAPM